MEIDPELFPHDSESEIETRFNLPDRCLHIFDIEGAETRIDVDDEMNLRRAVEEYIESGKDRLLDFTVVPNGADYTIKVSRIADWLVSSSDTRLVSRTINKALDRAAKANSLFDSDSE